MADLPRRDFLAQTGGAALAAMASATTLADSALQPANVLLIMSDEHNPRFSTPYGHAGIVTPNMDRLAARGTVYETCYCPSPLCMPSRSAFMAGRRVHEVQAYSNCNAFTFDYPSYGQVLRDQGVHTAYMGKADVYRPARELGFSEMIMPGDRKRPGDINHGRTPLMIRQGAAGRANGYGPVDGPTSKHDDKATQAAVDWLGKTGTTCETPWVLAVNLQKPHFPHKVSRDLWDLYPEGGDLPGHGPDEPSANHPYARDLRAHFETDQFSEEQTRGLRRGYLGCVTYVDRQVGRVLDALDAYGLAGNTIVIYTSDHGEMLGKFGMWWKCSLYEDSVRVPLVVAGPGFAAGARASVPVNLLDVQASLFAASGRERLSEWAGEPLQSLPAHDAERAIFAEYHGHGTRSGAYTIRKGPWKLIYCMDAPHQLFNLDEDPRELNNVAESHPAKMKELEEELRAVCSPEAENERAHAFERRQLAAAKAMTASGA